MIDKIIIIFSINSNDMIMPINKNQVSFQETKQLLCGMSYTKPDGIVLHGSWISMKRAIVKME